MPVLRTSFHLASRRPFQRRRAFSYVELTLAILILAICLVPALKALPDLIASQRGLETRYQLALVAQEKMAAAVLALQANFLASDTLGDLTAQGHADWHYHIVVTLPDAGSGRYAVLCSQAWVDANGNHLADASEVQVRFDTLVSNRNWTP